MKKIIKKILIIGSVIFLLIQLYQPARNLAYEQDLTANFTKVYTVPKNIETILRNSCYDCHSNYTNYPWYSNIQPVGFWLNHHIEEGKQHLNFSTFTKMPIAVQNHKLEEVIETVEEGEMPMPSYTYFGLHPKANLSAADKDALIAWAKAQMDTLKANYPADSLKLKPRKKV